MSRDMVLNLVISHKYSISFGVWNDNLMNKNKNCSQIKYLIMKSVYMLLYIVI